MKALEAPLRSYTKRVKGLWQMTYSDRLEELNLSSIERRTERYMILYIWKSLNGFVPSLGLSWNMKQGRSGPTLHIEALKGKVLSAKTIKAHSLKYHGTSIFNMLPTELKTFSGTVNQFKYKLDSFLTMFPDRPHVDG